MAWAAFIAAILFPMLILFTESRELGEVSMEFYSFAGAVVASYIGFATWDDVRGKRDE